MNRPLIDWLETVVIGVVGLGPTGIASRCVECRRAHPDAASCSGFGAGCLLKPPPPESDDSTSSG